MPRKTRKALCAHACLGHFTSGAAHFQRLFAEVCRDLARDLCNDPYGRSRRSLAQEPQKGGSLHCCIYSGWHSLCTKCGSCLPKAAWPICRGWRCSAQTAAPTPCADFRRTATSQPPNRTCEPGASRCRGASILRQTTPHTKNTGRKCGDPMWVQTVCGLDCLA